MARSEDGSTPVGPRDQRRQADLLAHLRTPNFTPAMRDWPEVITLLADDATADVARRALEKHAPVAVLSQWRTADEVTSSRLVRALGARRGDAQIRVELLAALSDERPRVARAAATALGKTRDAALAPELSANLQRARAQGDAPLERALITALGQVGASDALIAAPSSADGETVRRLTKARLVADRDRARKETNPVAAVVAADAEQITAAWHLTCRAGLAPLLADELAELGATQVAAVDAASVRAHGSLALVWRAVIALDVAAVVPWVASSDLAGAVVATLSSEAAARVLRGRTESPTRFRLEVAGGPHRALVWQVADVVERTAPHLSNDPVAAPFVVHVDPRHKTLRIVPRRSTRWPWRVAEVPAASHPTLAAALVRLAAPTANDHVWDPFVGSGVELALCGQAASVRSLYGSDISEHALTAARTNLSAANLPIKFELAGGDARTFRPPHAPTLIITNPPWGGRVRSNTPTLLLEFLTHAATLLAPGGRLVWVSPAHATTKKFAGLKLTQSIPLGGTGFATVVEVWHATSAAP